LFSLLAFCLPALAADPENPVAESPPVNIITAIEFSGNKVTRERILRQEMVIHEGDPADPALIERSRQAIMDLGLFKSVIAWLVPGEQGSVLRIHVKEKYYILPVPKLNRDEDNNFTLGAELTIDNMAGFNQQFKLRYESEEADTLSGGRVVTNSLFYRYPRVFGGPFLVETEFSKASSPVEQLTGSVPTTVYEKDTWTASLKISRWLLKQGPSRGWQLGGGLVWRQNNYDYVSGTATDVYRDARAVGVTLQGHFINVHDYLYSREGMDYGYLGEIGTPTLGSDAEYTRHEFYFRRYFLLNKEAHENIDMQLRVGLSSGDMFPTDNYAYAMGGNKNLRGYDSSSFTGNAFVQLNVQYLRQLFGYKPLRGVVFVDIGNTYPSNDQIHLGKLHSDVGVGLRFRLLSFVKIDLRVDAAYAHETGEWTYFAGTKEMF
jgi:outer membrane protein assembly factor BamA